MNKHEYQMNMSSSNGSVNESFPETDGHIDPEILGKSMLRKSVVIEDLDSINAVPMD